MNTTLRKFFSESRYRIHHELRQYVNKFRFECVLNVAHQACGKHIAYKSDGSMISH